MIKLGWHRRFAHWLGYDIDKFNKQLTVETHLRELLPRLGVDLVIDVGANGGQYAHILRYVGYTGRILSIEPNPQVFEELKRQTEKDSAWDAFQLALGEEEGLGKLKVSTSSVFSSFHAPNAFGESKFGKSILTDHVETVKIARLEDFIAKNVPDFSRRRVFLKMDTQGHDSAVMLGAGRYRDRFCGLQSEIAVTPIYDGIPDFMESLALYRSYGYEVTGLYTVNRHRKTGHVIEFDCVMAPRPNGD